MLEVVTKYIICSAARVWIRGLLERLDRGSGQVFSQPLHLHRVGCELPDVRSPLGIRHVSPLFLRSIHMSKLNAVYVRVSTVSQNLENQLPDLKRWAQAHDVAAPPDDQWLEDLKPWHGGNSIWIPDKFTGTT